MIVCTKPSGNNTRENFCKLFLQLVSPFPVVEKQICHLYNCTYRLMMTLLLLPLVELITSTYILCVKVEP